MGHVDGTNLPLVASAEHVRMQFGHEVAEVPPMLDTICREIQLQLSEQFIQLKASIAEVCCTELSRQFQQGPSCVPHRVPEPIMRTPDVGLHPQGGQGFSDPPSTSV